MTLATLQQSEARRSRQAPRAGRTIQTPSETCSPLEIHCDSREQVNHVTAGLVEIAARNSSRRDSGCPQRIGSKPRGWMDL